VASSNATALPDQIRDAGLLFDPTDTLKIADAVERMATDEVIREELRELGYRRAKNFSWERTAKAYRAVYRQLAGIRLTDEERWLLEWDWMREPQRTLEPIS
jgi:glycosyltransferase involved in cell wall biosynthesis